VSREHAEIFIDDHDTVSSPCRCFAELLSFLDAHVCAINNGLIARGFAGVHQEHESKCNDNCQQGRGMFKKSTAHAPCQLVSRTKKSIRDSLAASSFMA
jgi:hypothetical protein